MQIKMKQITMYLTIILLIASIVMEIICQSNFIFIQNTANKFIDAGLAHMSSKLDTSGLTPPK